MYRTALKEINKWKESPHRKPLVIEGARQVGKTWLMKEFGRLVFKDVVYVNFEAERQLDDLFARSLDSKSIISGLEIYTKKQLDPENTLIIFDEIQEVPGALTSLKYFAENESEYFIVCAGSLLGLALHEGTSFPVGKVDFLKLQPLTFDEFLRAVGDERLADLLAELDFNMINALSGMYIKRLREYYFVGGMPEAVMRYVESGNFAEVRDVQEKILLSYELDFSKHAPANVVPRIRAVWNSIPVHLSKENKKFVYGAIREGARAKEFETAIMWLSDCGLVDKVNRVSTPKIPLKAYEDDKAFKLYMLDVGLLGCLAGLDERILLDGNALFTEFKGALTEQYACQQLMSCNFKALAYYTNDRGSCEVDFVAPINGNIVPIEVKSEVNLKAKSLKTYREKFKPELAIRSSMADYKQDGSLMNLPLYALCQINSPKLFMGNELTK